MVVKIARSSVASRCKSTMEARSVSAGFLEQFQPILRLGGFFLHDPYFVREIGA